MSADDEKRLAAEAAAELVEDGMLVGLGTGITVAHFLPALARRGLRLRCVATSLQTESAARELGLPVESLGPVGDPAELAARLARRRVWSSTTCSRSSSSPRSSSGAAAPSSGCNAGPPRCD